MKTKGRVIAVAEIDKDYTAVTVKLDKEAIPEFTLNNSVTLKVDNVTAPGLGDGVEITFNF